MVLNIEVPYIEVFPIGIFQLQEKLVSLLLHTLYCLQVSLICTAAEWHMDIAVASIWL